MLTVIRARASRSLCAACVLTLSLGCGLRDRGGDGQGGGGGDGASAACIEAGERICAAACACGGCDILAKKPGVTTRIEAEDEASCIEAYSQSCKNDDRTDAELTACADAYETTECSEGAAVQPEVCLDET